MIPRDEQREKLVAAWRRFAEVDAGPYSPLYARIGRAVADDDELLALIQEAPKHAHLPLMLLASVHYLILSGLDHPLTDVYRGHSSEDPVPLFRDVCLSNRERLLSIMASHRMQTNECGRSAYIALGLALVADALGEPIALVDAGASAGLNMLYDRYDLNYAPLESLGDQDSSVSIRCRVQPHSFRLPSRLPIVPIRIGVDCNPVDLTEERERRWLLACVWPDTGRLERTVSALAIAAREQPTVIRGDVATELGAVFETIDGECVICVVTSAVYSYLDTEAKAQFIESLDAAGKDRSVAWLSIDAPGTVELFEPPPIPATCEIMPAVLGLATFRKSKRAARGLAITHPHGAWINWFIDSPF